MGFLVYKGLKSAAPTRIAATWPDERAIPLFFRTHDPLLTSGTLPHKVPLTRTRTRCSRNVE